MRAPRLRNMLPWILTIAVSVVSATPSAQKDVAPLPSAVVDKMVRLGTGAPDQSRAPSLTDEMSRTLTFFESQLEGQKNRKDKQAKSDLEAMSAAGAANEIRTLRQRLIDELGVESPTARIRTPRTMDTTRGRRDDAYAKLDALIRDLDAISGSDPAARTVALARVRSAMQRARAFDDESLQITQPRGTAFALPPKALEFPAASELPAHYLADQSERAQHLYAFAGEFMLLAAAPSTPTEAQSCSYTAADLAADGNDIELTQAIQDKAKALDYSPAAIFEFVANDIGFEPYYGALKGAANTLLTQTGSATDKSSLLIALLRASNIPSRYVRGRVNIVDTTPLGADSRVNKWLRVKNYPAASARLAQGRNPEAATILNGASQAIGAKWSHVWVEACVPYAHYRGAKLDNAGHRWIPLDPSFETRRYRAEIEISAAFSFDTFLAQRSVDLPHERFETQAAPLLAASNLAVNEAGYTSTKAKTTIDILPASLPYTVEAFTAWPGTSSAEISALPTQHRYVLDLEVETNAGTDLLTPLALRLRDATFNRLTLGFEGVNAAAQTALLNWRNDPNPDAAVPCGTQVVAVVRSEGTAIGTSSTAQDICVTDATPNRLKLQVRLPELGAGAAQVVAGCGPSLNAFCTFDGIRAADLYAAGIYGWQTTTNLLTARAKSLVNSVNSTSTLSASIESTMGEYLHLVGLKYLRYLADSSRRIGRLAGETGDLGISFGLTSTTSKAERVLDQPLGIQRRGMLVDFPGIRNRSVNLSTGNSDFERFKLMGYAGSALESYVWAENARLDAVSTVRGLQFGNENINTQMLTLTSGTGTSGLINTTTDPIYGYTASFITSLQTDYLTLGYEVKIPKRQIQYNDWKGSVFAATRNQGSFWNAAFIIGGGYSGGYTTGSPASFLYNPVSGLGYRTSGNPSASGTNLYTPSFISNGAIGNGSSPLNSYGGDPVNLATGNLYHAERDLVIPARDLPFVLERTYNSLEIGATPGRLGYGWRHSFEHELRFLDERADGATNAADTDTLTSTIEWLDGTGARRRMLVTGTAGGVAVGATMTRPEGFFFTTVKTATGYDITEKNGLKYTFENVPGTVGQVAKLTKITSRNGNTLTLAYSGGKLTTVTDDNARALIFSYTGERLTAVQDFTNRRHEYTYIADELRTYRNPLAVAGSQAPVTYEYFTSIDGPRIAHAMKRYTLPKGNGMAFEYYVNGRVLRHTNTRGEQYTYRYDDFRRETVITDARGFERAMLFDNYGNPVKVTEEDGGIWTYAYASASDPHLRTQATNPYGHITQYAYDLSGNLQQVTNPSGATIVYGHYAANTFGRPGKVKDARGNYRLFKYTATGNLTDEFALKEGVGAALDPATYTANAADLLAYTRHTFDAGNRTSTKQVRDVANNRGLSLTWGYTAQKLYPTQITRDGDKDGDGLVSDDADDVAPLNYDTLGRLTAGVDAHFEAVAFSYDTVDRITRGTDAVGQARDYRFDANGNAISDNLLVIGTGAPKLLDSTSHEFDANDRRVTTLDAGGGVTRFTYDPQGNLTNVLDPDGFTLGFEYDAKGRVTTAFDEEGRQATRTLDSLGRELRRLDPNGNTTTYIYYGAAQDGRLQKTCDGENRCTTFEYDANGNVTRLIDNLTQDTVTQYDALNRPVRIAQATYPDTVLGAIRPITCYSYDLLGNLKEVKAGHSASASNTCTVDAATLSLQASHSYDDRGNRLSSTDALNRTTTAQYDIHDNPTQVLSARGNRVEQDYGYGGLVAARRGYAPGNILESTEAYLRNALGQVTSVTGPNVNYSYGYDTAHRLDALTDSRANQTLRYHWSSGGLLDRMTGPQNETTDYLYDPVGRLRHVFAPNNTLVEYQYDAAGRVIEQTLPGGVTTRTSYFKDNALKTAKTTKSATTLLDVTFTQDGLGRRATLTESLSGLPSRTQTYGYDSLSRLTTVQEGATTQTLTYDPFGNRRTYYDGATTRFYAHDAAHQMDTVRTGSAAGPIEFDFSYDANGNTTTRDATGTANDWTYSYNAKDQFTQASKPGTAETYQYDDHGRRITKTTNSARTDYLYDGLNIYLEVNGDWSSPTARLTHAGLDQPLLRATTSQTQAYTQDGFNSAVLTTDAATGAVIATQRFDPFGNRTAGAGTVPLYGYTGREPDTTGLTFMRARYYDASIGRFTQADPLGFIEGVNQYAYAVNNPINRSDPLGTVSQAFTGMQSSYGGPAVGALTSGQQSLFSLTPSAAQGYAGSARDPLAAALDRQAATPEIQPLTHEAALDFALSFGPMGAAAGATKLLGPLAKGVAGRFANLDAMAVKFDNLTPHHMPQAAAGFTSRADGGALVLPQVEHVLTRTYGFNGAVTAAQEAGAAFRDVLARDIRDIRNIAGSQYNEGLRTLVDYYRTNFPGLMLKK